MGQMAVSPLISTQTFKATKDPTYIDVEIFNKEQLGLVLVVGRITVELVGTLVPFDLEASI